jgi:hypothetical protein
VRGIERFIVVVTRNVDCANNKKKQVSWAFCMLG